MEEYDMTKIAVTCENNEVFQHLPFLKWNPERS